MQSGGVGRVQGFSLFVRLGAKIASDFGTKQRAKPRVHARFGR
jgi:hypothetical protein